MSTVTTAKKFEEGNVHPMSFVGDSNLKPEYIVIKVTPKTVTFEKFQGTEKFTRRIRTDHNGIEYIRHGSYSMAPTISANKITR